MAIKLNITKPRSDVEAAVARGYLYKDINFDLSLNFLKGREMTSTRNTKDLNQLYDKDAIITSLTNLLTTSPGEKLLNPTFGLDFRDYLFEIVSETKAFFLAQTIFEGITSQEPRISVDFVEVIAVIDEMEYIINLELSIPELEIYKISLKGYLNLDGYIFI